MKNLSMQYSEIYKLPVRFRKYFIDSTINDSTNTKSKVGTLEIDDDTPISQIFNR